MLSLSLFFYLPPPNKVSTSGLTLSLHDALPIYQRDRRAARAQDLVVERLPRLAPTTARGPIVAQPHDHQLAERVVEIGGIIGAARGLLAGGAFVLIALVDEHLSRLVLRHALGVEPDRRQEAAIAQQRVG